MNIDGQNTLACLKRINTDGPKPVKIYPLPHSELQSHHRACGWQRDVKVASIRALPPLVTFLYLLLLPLTSLTPLRCVCSVHCQGSRTRHDPILQAIQIHPTLFTIRSARRPRAPAKSSRPQEARWNVRVHPLRVLLYFMPFILVESG